MKVYCSDSDYLAAITAAGSDAYALSLIYKLSGFEGLTTDDFKTIFFSKLDTEDNYIFFND